MRQIQKIILREQLDWLYNCADSKCGIKSNWEAMNNARMYGFPTLYADPYSEALVYAISKKRRIEKRLATLSQLHQRILYYTYSYPTIDKNVKAYFAEYAGAAYCIIDRDQVSQVVKLCLQKQISKLTIAQETALIAIKCKAISQLTEAEQAFFESKFKKE